jgi:hypothetical protein
VPSASRYLISGHLSDAALPVDPDLKPKRPIEPHAHCSRSAIFAQREGEGRRPARRVDSLAVPQLRAPRGQNEEVRLVRLAGGIGSYTTRFRSCSDFGRILDGLRTQQPLRCDGEYPAHPQRITKMLYIIRTEPTPACSAPILTRECTSAHSSLEACETCGASRGNLLTRRWTIGGDSIITCCWEETVPSE